MMKPTCDLACAFFSAGLRVTTEMGSLNSASIRACSAHSSSNAVDHARAIPCGRVGLLMSAHFIRPEQMSSRSASISPSPRTRCASRLAICCKLATNAK